MINKIIRTNFQTTIGLQTFPAQYAFDLKNVPEKFVGILRKEFQEGLKKGIKIFSGDIEYLMFDENVQEEDGEGLLKSLEKLSLDELQAVAAKLKIKAWSNCKKETLKEKIKDEISMAKKEAIITEKPNEVKAEKENIEIIKEDGDNVFVKGTRKLLDFLGFEQEKEGVELEITKDDLAEFKAL